MRLPLFLARRQLAPLFIALLGALAAAGAYLQALGYPFVSDDYGYLTESPKLAELRFTELWRLFTETYNSAFEFLPLRDFSYWLDLALFGLNSAAFRLHNILLYLLCLPLVYAATLELWRYFRPADAASAPWAAAASTALFALHPSHAEAVVWIAGRKDVLSAMLSLLALWLAARSRRAQGLSAPYAAAALLALLAAMLSKASTVAVAPVIAVLWLLFWHDIPAQNRRYSLLLWPLASLLLAACIALIFAAIIKTRIPMYLGIESATRALAIQGWLARLAVSPESRHYFYPVLDDPYFPAMVALGVAVLIAAVVGGVVLMRRRSLAGFSVLAFFLLCAPSLQLVPYMPPSLVSDRFLALAVWPAVLLLVVLAWRLKPAPRAALLLAIALSWGFQTVGRPRDWRSFEAVIDADLRAYPGYYMPAVYKIVAIQLPQGLYRDAGETARNVTLPKFRDLMLKMVRANYAVYLGTMAGGKPQEAANLLWEWGLDLKQRPAQAKWNPPVHLLLEKITGRFAGDWENLAKHFPDDASLRYNAGLSLLSLDLYAHAIVHLRAATESRQLPESVRGVAFKNLGLALLYGGQIAEAETALRAALEQAPPDMRAHCLLSGVYKQTGRAGEAARADANCPARAPGEETAQGNK